MTHLGGAAAGQFGVVNVGGAAMLAGTLSIQLVNGFVPTAGRRSTF